VGVITAIIAIYLLIGYIVAIVAAYHEARTQDEPIAFMPSRVLLQVICWGGILLWEGWKVVCIPVAMVRGIAIRVRNLARQQGESE
jgi:hypothetical protein